MHMPKMDYLDSKCFLCGDEPPYKARFMRLGADRMVRKYLSESQCYELSIRKICVNKRCIRYHDGALFCAELHISFRSLLYVSSDW